MAPPRRGVLDVDLALSVCLTFDSPLIRVGRASRCELHIPDTSVDPEHAVLIRDGDDYVLVDSGSEHGTWVLEPGSDWHWRRLAPGARHSITGVVAVRFGSVELLINTLRTYARAADEPSHRRLFTTELIERAHQGGRLPFPIVYVVKGPDSGVWVDLLERPGRALVVGRDKRASVRVVDPYTSRAHFELSYSRSNRSLLVRDLGTAGGTWFGQSRLERHTHTYWKPGAPLCAGHNTWLYRCPSTQEESERGSDDSARGAAAFPPATVGAGARSEPSNDETLAPGGPLESGERPVEAKAKAERPGEEPDPQAPEGE